MSLFIAFEDSQRFFSSQRQGPGELTPMDELAGVIRGSGKGICALVQSMEGLSRRLIPNLATKIMGRMGSARDYAQLGADLALTGNQIAWARRNLAPGTFLMQCAEGPWREPMILRTPQINIPRVSDEEVERSTQPLGGLPVVPAQEFARWTQDDRIELVGSSTGSSSRGESKAFAKHEHPTSGETKQELDYLESIATSPFLSATERDGLLNLSAWKGNRIRQSLKNRGLIAPVSVNLGGRGRQIQLLELKEDARTLMKRLGVPNPTGRGRGGLEHQFWCDRIVNWLAANGITSAIEREVQGARVDVAIGAVLAVEVECSAGHEITNVRKDLAAGFQQVVCLVPNSNAAERVRKQLDVEGFGIEVSRVGTLTEYHTVLTTSLSDLHLIPDEALNKAKSQSQLTSSDRDTRDRKAQP